MRRIRGPVGHGVVSVRSAMEKRMSWVRAGQVWWGPAGRPVRVVSVSSLAGRVVLASLGGGVFPMEAALFRKTFSRDRRSGAAAGSGPHEDAPGPDDRDPPAERGT